MTKNHVDINHPVSFLRKLSEKIPANTKFVFEVYKRINKNYDQGQIGQEISFLTGLELTDSWTEIKNYTESVIQTAQNNFGTNYELGLKSLTNSAGHLINIPMIDFIGRPSRTRLLELIEHLSKVIGPHYFWIFDSGRSWHAYAETLISPLQLKRYYDALKHYSDIVDIPWLEYSLIRGHAVLRWSAITTHHDHMPIFLEKIKCD